MDYIKIPLSRSNNQINFDITKIENRDFIKKTLKLSDSNFRFKNFGFCKDSALFYIVIDEYDNILVRNEAIYRFSFFEFNEEYYVKNIQKLTYKEKITCDFAIIS